MSEQKYKNYKFKIDNNIDKKTLNVYQSIKIYSKRIDDDTLLLTLNGGGGFSLYLKDRFFNFSIDSETKRVSAFEGELKVNELKFAKSELPSLIENAVLSLDTDENLVDGIGSYIDFNTDLAYDKEKGIFQIGNIDFKKLTYKIFSNLYVQLDKTGIMKSVIIGDIEL